MPTLNWKNVTGSKLDTGAESLQQAGSLFSKAFENFSGAVEGRQKRETASNTEEVLNRLRGAGSREELEAATGGLGDLNALKEQAGGQLDTAAIDKFTLDKRGYFDQQEASALQKEGAAFTLQRQREGFRREDEARLRQKGAQQFASGLNQEQRTLEARNQAAFNQAIAAEQERTEGPLQTQLDAGGNVITAPGTPLQVQEDFKTDVIARGGGEIQSIKQLRDKADAYADTNSLSPSERTILHKNIVDQYDRSVFSPVEQAEIDKEVSTINNARDLDVANVDSVTERAINRIKEDVAPTEKEVSVDKNSFLTRVRTLSPNKTITGFTGPGGTQGGTKLVNIIDALMREEFPALEAWEVEQFLIGNVDGENDAWFSFDTSADVDGLRANLAEYVGQRGGSYQDRASAKREALYSAGVAQKNDIRSKAAQKNSSKLALRETAAGKVSRGKNIGVFNPIGPKPRTAAETGLREAVKNTPAFKKSVPKAKTAPKTVEKTLNEYLDRAKNKKPDEPAFKYTDEAKKAITTLRARGEKAKVAREAKSLQDAIDKIALDKLRHERIYGK